MIVKTSSALYDGGMRFVARTGSGHELVLDDSSGDAGARPVELLLVAQAGCTGMDVISILRKKRQPVEGYEIRASGIQEDEHPNAFTRIDIVHVVTGGGVEVAAVRRAIELSATKYCSVGSTLASGLTEIHHRYVVRGPEGPEEGGEVLVIGPFAAPGVSEAEPSPAVAAPV